MVATTEHFDAQIDSLFSFQDNSIILGGAMYQGETRAGKLVRVPLSMLSRHGLISGATGTGKTITIQNIAGLLSDAGVSVLLMDLKGDLSGIAAPGTMNPKIEERHGKIGIGYEPTAYPVEFMSLSGERGFQIRNTVTEFGPVLLSRILDLTDTQESVLSVIFQFCDNEGLLLLDLADFKAALTFIEGDGKEAFEKEYGAVSSATIGVIRRKIAALESEGADKFFGEVSFDVEDLVHVNKDGKGQISIVRLDDMQSKQALFSTFMLSLLAEVYEKFPEEGDLDKPKLAIFFEEAHLLFSNANKSLLNQIISVTRLIRSKGVGLYFITQRPDDIPEDVLSQLGLKVQHALRAFTAKDREAIRKMADNFPPSEFYQIDELITTMGVGEALVSTLNPKGIPTPPVHVMLTAPSSRIGVLEPAEVEEKMKQSLLADKYAKAVDRESAYEMLSAKAEKAAASEEEDEKGEGKRAARQEDKSLASKVSENKLVRDIGRTVAREVARGLLGSLGVKSSRPSSRSRRKTSLVGGILDSLF